jgi:predicted GH43/DUF377 family glycosyl hydrolase
MLEHLHQLAVHAYYAGELDAGRRACERLLGMELTPERERVVRRNRSWYTQTIDELVACRFQRFDVEPAAGGWSTFNPTIIAHEDGYLAIVRSSNYRIVDGQYVIPPADGNQIRTVNTLARLGSDLSIVGTPSAIPQPVYPTSDYPVDGFEDCRLNDVGGEVIVSATVRNWAGRDGTCRIATATLIPYIASLVEPAMIDEPLKGRHEKNWMPITGTAAYLYSCWDDGRVATVQRDGWQWVIEHHAESPAIARGWRGGSQLVDIGDGRWLALVHEVADDTGGRIYEHRFVLFDEDSWQIAGRSPAFAFRESRAIEFAAGLARRGDQLVATFGVRDAEAWMAEMSVRDVISMIGGKDG